MCSRCISTSIHVVRKNLDIRDVFQQKHGDAHVYPHENTKMARGRNCVSSSHHRRAWKHVCVKHAFFCVSSRLKSVAVFPAQAHPNRCFCQNSSHFEIKS
jgi:hypothetical protein